MSEDEKRRQLTETLMRIRELDRTSACLQARLQDARRAYGYLYEGLDTPNVLIKPTGEEGRFDTAFGPVTAPDAVQVASDLKQLKVVLHEQERRRELERRM